MVNECLAARRYSEWLAGTVQGRVVDGDCVVTIPFYDPSHDSLELLVRRSADGGISISDGGYILGSFGNGDTLSDLPEPRAMLIAKILEDSGLSIVGGEIIGDAEDEFFPIRFHEVVQCILRLVDVFELRLETPKASFQPEVATFLRKRNVQFEPGRRIVGYSELPHVFDFGIDSPKGEHLIKIVSRADAKTTGSIIFAHEDIARRNTSPNLFALYDDRVFDFPNSKRRALERYGIPTIRWQDTASVEHMIGVA
ncbi:MAG TPA: DUF1828 domain-containing protein [Rectinemataceae bacterium]|nr:DUF1828 domain-containing protein [Rectinemataceae bacterium]